MKNIKGHPWASVHGTNRHIKHTHEIGYVNAWKALLGRLQIMGAGKKLSRQQTHGAPTGPRKLTQAKAAAAQDFWENGRWSILTGAGQLSLHVFAHRRHPAEHQRPVLPKTK